MNKIIKKLFNIDRTNADFSRRGFTLLEAIIYLTIVGIVISAFVDFAITMGNTTAKMSANIDASRNRRFALTTINYLIRNSDGLLKDIDGDCSNLSVSPPILALYFNSDSYLPGTCVENGGGVKITVEDNRLLMNCYPNITNNGQYNACSATVGENYFLTGPEVIVTNSNLDFAIATASTTSNSYSTITTHLKVTLPSADQISLRASSEATSTVEMRNQQSDGLISWYKFDDTATSLAVDSVSGNNLVCSGPSSVTGLVSGSTSAFEFGLYEFDLCYADNPEKFNFGDSFTISVWLKQATDSDAPHNIFLKQNGLKGYHLYTNESSGNIYFDLCDGTSCSIILADENNRITYDDIFNVIVVYNKPNEDAKMFIYKKGVGNVGTTTAAIPLPFLVNDNTANYPRVSDDTDADFHGVLDELRLYNRALSNSEVWALQSQGAN